MLISMMNTSYATTIHRIDLSITITNRLLGGTHHVLTVSYKVASRG